ncbi:hypothetical protein [Haloferax volcanii]|uniref:Uncharacterized protein n=1 Tax=Haloferax volcanii TaxID=2246 RepID=A0A558FU81_HALVO|nr:hypothetical protein [Haloferax volcanii]TVT89077.1 hypothetical protein FQA18_18655 [Haloferax volcanii]
MTTVHSTPVAVIPHGVAFYFESGSDETVRHEGRIVLYEDYIRLCGGPLPSWVPCKNVEQVLEG